jgi:hypothetical protein
MLLYAFLFPRPTTTVVVPTKCWGPWVVVMDTTCEGFLVVECKKVKAQRKRPDGSGHKSHKGLILIDNPSGGEERTGPLHKYHRAQIEFRSNDNEISLYQDGAWLCLYRGV